MPYDRTMASQSASPSSLPPWKTSTNVRGSLAVGCVASRKWPGMPIMSKWTPTRRQTAAKSTDSEIGMPVRDSSTWSSSELLGE
eukprot:scaffold298742_cov33-Tisochrysis_lutea.AAC.3